MFVDRVEIEVQAGHGGDGCVCFRREKYIPRGGPNGGDGGDGGSIILRAEQDVDSLSYVGHKHQWRAANGEPGRGADCHGRSAQDTVIPLPPGTLIIDTSGGGFILKDLVNVGDEIIAAQGGNGGKGNTRFKSSTNRAPRQFTPGGEGEIRKLRLELKVIADVGLVGKPNAGKSTLLSRLSRARPEIADYPFTTKFPNLGIVQIDQDRSFVMADIPGLIEGAHAGVGLGHEFLRHVERAGILVHLVEPLPTDGTDPLTNYRAIRQELAQYDITLAERPEIIVVTKSEIPGSEELRASLAAETGADVLAISAVTGQNLNLLTRRIATALAERNERAAARA